jgi:hypothetical protein
MSRFSAALSDIISQSGSTASTWSQTYDIDLGMLSKLRSAKVPCTHDRLMSIVHQLPPQQGVYLVREWLRDQIPAQFSTDLEITTPQPIIHENENPLHIDLYGFSQADQEVLIQLVRYARQFPDVLDWLRATVETLGTHHNFTE